MGILRTIGRMLAAIAMAGPTMVWEAGKWVLRCMPGYVPPAPADVVEEYEDLAVAKDVTPDIDRRVDNLQVIADALLHGKGLDPATLDGLSPKSLNWLELLDRDMLQIVATAKPSDLKRHLDNSYSITGLLRFEQNAMDDYRERAEADRLVPRRPAKSRKEDLELFAPALGR